jgi:16S rRNA (guanine966-N2)-methyltransferase
MKIITGSAKGRRLKTPKSAKTIRPALSVVREAIFSSLGDVEGLIFLDVFAGTGSLGLEALSRGAGFSYFVDGNSEAVGLIIHNLQTLGFAECGHVYKRSLPSGLRGLKLQHQPNVIFCDPPYDKNLLNPTLKALVEHKFIDPQTIVIVEHSTREHPLCASLELIKERHYGQTLISTLRLQTNRSE